MTNALAPAIVEWFRISGRDLPWRSPGFPAWGTLVSEFMLQQTPVVRVLPRLTEWLDRWPKPSALAAVPPGEAVRAWQSLGYPRRALRLHACAVTIADKHYDVVPDDIDTLLTLPGIGDYTARAIAVFAYGHRHPVVDTNVRRVIARAVHGCAEPAPPRTKADLAAMATLLPERLPEAAAFNAGMMELGAIVCTARLPRCETCPIRDNCRWRSGGYPAYTGPTRAKQKRFEGSDRQVRGLILAELRAARTPVTARELEALWPKTQQRSRALAGLLTDGLATGDPDSGYLLPDS
ncbi:A/G-specific adenine glycosylase [Rathayibacter toxicus]|uniref:Adenine DNA glycosylase n=1 Tax=Rathayibacter toxicus TaxID=145458 RepID=A0A2S5Y5Z5_9MICO|nr:A/G-specific adenine glycosylase [Rathayibacter toxicus]PPH22586.1 A/G-specific adenine glycosylase [Rathayibacter toxicus]PPH56788.1 A/G-specific adenine glycosylase [Rathayibacter toxicus]PPH59480.1 A/G-specific adenine glycosylase [Rathayibacter toxicus]PPH86710.1 A/G-specific adenine glycosylase [Rathayibacter toxicus]PPI14428.1 A/G-specific adenine glycosylase [Rathayibacter toxicus]